MHYSIIGILGYMLFYIYDINQIKKINNKLKATFQLGLILQIIGTIGIITDNREYLKLSILGVTISLIGFIFLIYALFFALPFKETYIKVSEKRKVYNRGIYAMSRHPGVLFYIILYLGLGIMQPTAVIIGTYTIWCLLNIGYIIMQDLWTFPRTFVDYSEYRKNTPFLIPTLKSIKSTRDNI